METVGTHKTASTCKTVSIHKTAGIRKTVSVRCVLCSGDGAQEAIRTLSARGSSVKLVRCRNCGLVFLNPRLASVSEVYESDAMKNSVYYAESIENDKDTFRQRLAFVRGFLKNKKTALDIGASVGTFLAVCREGGFTDVHGVELNPGSRAQAKDLFSLTLVKELPGDVKADLINMSDLIEHLEDPLDYLKKLRAYMEDDGVLLITTPDYERWITKVVNIKPEEHLFYFTRATLGKLLEKAGYEVLHMGNTTRFVRFRHLVRSSTTSNPLIRHPLSLMVALRLDGIGEKILFHNLNNDILCVARKK
jgi:SAM-dependent methyltransferase